jgi:hypothetical protein
VCSYTSRITTTGIKTTNKPPWMIRRWDRIFTDLNNAVRKMEGNLMTWILNKLDFTNKRIKSNYARI